MAIDEEKFKPEYRTCKLCLTPYKLGVPYNEANSPARDLCDDCIINLSEDSFRALAMDAAESEKDSIIIL